MTSSDLHQQALRELVQWERDTVNLVAAAQALKAIKALQSGQAMVVPCTWREYTFAHFDFAASPDWDTFPANHPLRNAEDWKVLFAPFSPEKPNIVCIGSGDNRSWMVIRPIPAIFVPYCELKVTAS
jgi:hypothetical protein